MLIKIKHLNPTLLILLIALSLTACGGGSGSSSPPTTAATPTLTFNAIKIFNFTWTDVSGATHYKLLENADGVSGFTQVGNDIPQGIQNVDHVVPLYARLNGQYILQTCYGDLCIDSTTITINDTLVDAIGYFKASNTGLGDVFGSAVSLSANGNTLAVGAYGEGSNTTGVESKPNDDGTADGSGAVYVFTRTGTTWAEQTYVKTSNTGMGDKFGFSLDLSADGNTLAVGAIGDDSNTTGVNSIPNDDGSADDSGAVYIFTRTGTAWAEQAYIKVSNTGAVDEFGESVSLSGDGNTLVVGATGEDSNTTGVGSTPNDDGSTNGSGAVYVLVRMGITWSEQAYIKASNTGTADSFGTAVSLSRDGNTLAVGAIGENSTTTGVDSIPNNGVSAIFTGAVYVFALTGTTWAEQSYIKASNSGTAYFFGQDVSLSADGNTLAVGSYGEGSNTTGVNSTPNDNGFADGSGAVYVFARTGTTWAEQAYVKGSNTGKNDLFGYAVSLSVDGNTLAVGARDEQNNTTGVFSTPIEDGFAGDSGAVYVFTRSGTIWAEKTYIKASNAGAGDRFGSDVCLSEDGNTLAVGAFLEESNTTGVGSTPNDDGTAVLAGAVYLY